MRESAWCFFFNATATTEIYTLSLHDALPISSRTPLRRARGRHRAQLLQRVEEQDAVRDRKSTRLNSSHMSISYAVFCLKKKKKNHINLLSRTQNKQKNTDI